MFRTRFTRGVGYAAAAALFLAHAAPTARAKAADATSGFDAVAALADDQTVAVVEVNLDAIDVDAAAKWITDAAGKSGQPEKAVADARREIGGAAGAVRTALADLRNAKAHRLYVIFSLADPQAVAGAAPGLIAVPLGAGADAAAIANVLKSASAGGGGAAGGNGPATATVGGAVVAGSAARVEQAQAKQKPAAAGLRTGGAGAAATIDRAAVEEALAAAGDAPVRVALVASADLRKVFEQQMPDLPAPLGGGRTEGLTRGVRWAAFGLALPPSGSARLVVKATDGDAAMRVGEQLGAAVRVLREDRGAREVLGDAFVNDAVKRLTAKVEGDRVTVSLDQQAFDRFVPAFAVGLRQQRAVARAQVTMSNMKQILLACAMHANDNRGAFVAQEKWQDVLTKEQNLGKNVFENPRVPGKVPGYVYVRPPAGFKDPTPAETVVLYESAEVEGDTVGVGYLDGHVVMMAKADFEKKVKPKLPAAPAR